MVAPAALERSWSGTDGPPVWETVLGDGLALEHEIGTGGDHRFRYGSTLFHISAAGDTVLCAPEDRGDPAWQRQLLDTILFSASFVNGFELLHASAVEFPQGVVAFVAPSGGGKSSAASELMRRGMPLFCDDVLAIGETADGVACFPAPPVMNLPEAAASPSELGCTVIAGFPEERELWVALSRPAASPRPLAGVYLLERDAPETGAFELRGPAVLELLRHAISLPHSLARARSRFRLFSTLAESVPVRRLCGGGTADPAALADLVEDSLRQAPAILAGAGA